MSRVSFLLTSNKLYVSGLEGRSRKKIDQADVVGCTLCQGEREGGDGGMERGGREGEREKGRGGTERETETETQRRVKGQSDRGEGELEDKIIYCPC